MLFAEPEILYFENFDLKNVVTPVIVDELKQLLKLSKYNKKKAAYLIKGFKDGVSLGYQGKMNIRRTAPNLKLSVGNETILWNKVMKEVKAGRYAGPFPFENPPFEFFIQSPIGLVPKDNGTEFRLIFHLSYPRTGSSVNSETPEDMCTVSYPKFDEAIKLCLSQGRACFIAKSDMKSAFRGFGIKPEHWPLLLMKARSPLDRKWYWFVDKCLPFGSLISCRHFQEFSNAILHIVTYFMGKKNVNYLDDYLFSCLKKLLCDGQVEIFLKVCRQINFPVNMDKTLWGTMSLTFLGLLIDTVRQLVCIPIEKVQRAISMIEKILSKRKTTVREIQKTCGFLNFLCKAIVPGRAFTRRLYAYTAGKDHEGNKKQLLPHHHVTVTWEMKNDLSLRLKFLNQPTVYCRPFIDFDCPDYKRIPFFTDASRNFDLGFGGYCQNSWMMCKWDSFTKSVNPSIGYLELFAAVAGVLAWVHRFKNKRVTISVDNQSVLHMINETTSGCKNCMVLIRLLVLECLHWNVKLRVIYVKSKDNDLADALSRGQWSTFNRLARKRKLLIEQHNTPVPEKIWPISKIWIK